MSSEVVDVIVVGCGPVGGAAANFLGLHGLRTLVLERELSEHSQPRAFSLDDETLRIFQDLGLVGDLAVALQTCKKLDYIDAAKRVLVSVIFGRDFGYGHPAGAFFNQPQLESVLRKGLRRFPHVELHIGHEVMSFHQEPDFVTVEVKDRLTGRTRTLRSRYLLGCDGSHSIIRRKLGIAMTGSSYEEPWITISGTTPTSEPDFSYLFCNPRRPGFVTRGALNEVRMDFLLLGSERAEVLEKPEIVERLMQPFIDPKTVTLQRASVYTFHRRVAERWREGRIFLAGDAAHIMPPFMGQGLCSGFRDAANLTWKLALVARGLARPSLLDTYEQERRPHTEEIIKATMAIGTIFLTRNPVIAAIRNIVLRVLNRIPRTQRIFRDYEMKPKPLLPSGFMTQGKRRSPAAPEGEYLIQPKVGLPDGRSVYLDDALGHGFAVLTRADVAEPVLRSAQATAQLLDGRLLRVLPASQAAQARPGDVVDLEGKLAEWLAARQADTVVVRPDRYVFGASSGPAIDQLREELSGHMEPPSPRSSLEAQPARVSSGA